MCKYLLLFLSIPLLTLSTSLPVYSATALKDPTRPPNAKLGSPSRQAGASPNWYLSSTLISGGRRNAVINGRLVSLGQTIKNAKVVSIRPNEVWLLHKQKRFRIKLLSPGIKDFSKSAAK